MRIVLIEFPWHVKKILSNKSSFEKDVIVSLDPESSYELKINNIAYYETYQFCNHRELWLKYKDITEHTINITKILDQALWKMDKRFQEINWQLFDDYHFPLKTQDYFSQKNL